MHMVDYFAPFTSLGIPLKFLTYFKTGEPGEDKRKTKDNVVWRAH